MRLNPALKEYCQDFYYQFSRSLKRGWFKNEPEFILFFFSKTIDPNASPNVIVMFEMEFLLLRFFFAFHNTDIVHHNLFMVDHYIESVLPTNCYFPWINLLVRLLLVHVDCASKTGQVIRLNIFKHAYTFHYTRFSLAAMSIDFLYSPYAFYFINFKLQMHNWMHFLVISFRNKMILN